jgi:hypothetical protein
MPNYWNKQPKFAGFEDRDGDEEELADDDLDVGANPRKRGPPKPRIREPQLELAKIVCKGSLQQAADAVEEWTLKHEHRGPAWKEAGADIREFFDSGLEEIPFSCFVEGNQKLPFWKFSALAVHTCPGAGPCAEWCYSLKAWRYPDVFFNHVQNTILMRFASKHLKEPFFALPNVPFRIYVDGDFDSMQTLEFWMQVLAEKRHTNAYCYTKSWDLFLQYDYQGGQWPENFCVNLSNGSKNDDNKFNMMRRLPCVRGPFFALPLPEHLKKYEKAPKKAPKDVKAAVAARNEETFHKIHKPAIADMFRKHYGEKKVFPCPGKCAECLKGGKHACGQLDGMRDILIGLGIH